MFCSQGGGGGCREVLENGRIGIGMPPVKYFAQFLGLCRMHLVVVAPRGVGKGVGVGVSGTGNYKERRFNICVSSCFV